MLHNSQILKSILKKEKACLASKDISLAAACDVKVNVSYKV